MVELATPLFLKTPKNFFLGGFGHIFKKSGLKKVLGPVEKAF